MASGIRHPVVAFGEALWDLHPDGALLGGAPLNFTYRVQGFGQPCSLVSQIGADALGEKVRARMRELAMDTTYLFRDSRYPTGTVEIRLDAGRNPDYTIVPDVAYDYIPWSDALRELSGRAECLAFGTLAQRRDVSRATLRRMVGDFSGPLLFYDVNLRKKCYDVDVLTESFNWATVVKLNDEEASVVNELLSMGAASVREFGERMVRRFGLVCCLVTMGARGACAVSADGEEIEVEGIPVDLADPLGAGDAFSAGFVCTHLADESLTRATIVANAMGAVVATQHGGASQPVEESELQKCIDRTGRKPGVSLLDAQLERIGA